MTKSTTTRRALFTSATAILLCVVMLVGTTFAWFTDTASTNVNRIVAGTLDVQLLGEDGKSVEGETLEWKTFNDRAQTEIFWEPGATYELESVTIVNKGSLALKYKIEISNLLGDNALKDAIDWTVKVGETAVNLAEYEGHLAADASDVLTISGTMKTSAGNAYMGKSIDGVAITVLATQAVEEYDSTVNNYDAGAVYPVNTAEELTNAIAAAKDGDVIVLSGNLNTNDATDENGNPYNATNRLVLSADNVTLDLNGNELTTFNHTITVTGDNVTIKNGTLVATTANPSQTYGSYVLAVGGKNVVLENLTTTGGISVNAYDEAADEDVVKYADAYAIIRNCYITNTNYYAVCAQGGASAYVSNCTLNCENGKATFWIEQSTNIAAASSLTYEKDTVTITGSLPLYNTSGLAPIEK